MTRYNRKKTPLPYLVDNEPCPKCGKESTIKQDIWNAIHLVCENKKCSVTLVNDKPIFHPVQLPRTSHDPEDMDKDDKKRGVYVEPEIKLYTKTSLGKIRKRNGDWCTITHDIRLHNFLKMIQYDSNSNMSIVVEY